MINIYKHFYSIIVLVILPHSLFSERLNSDAELRQEVTQKPVIVLYSGLEIDSDYPSNDFVKVEIFLLVRRADFIDIERIRQGTMLVDTNGKTIGKTLSDFDALVVEDNSPAKVRVRLRGYIPRGAIDPTSIPETELDTLIQNLIDICYAKSLLSHIKKFKYVHALDYGGFSSYIKYNAELISSPGLRVLLVFYDEKLFAVVHPNTITTSRIFPFQKSNQIIQYFTKDKVLIEKFKKGFLFQYNSAG